MPEFYYQTTTTNTSCLLMYQYLSAKGIRNNKFFLRLVDRSLMRVNPFDKDLSEEMMGRIIKECTINPWYYLRECVRIPETGGTTRFKLNPGTLAEVFCMLNNISVILLLPRQQGKTITAISLLDWIYNFGTTNTAILFGNKFQGDAELNVSRYKGIHGLLPDYLRGYNKADGDNIRTVTKVSLKNKIDALTTPNTIDQASKLGRGLTSPILYWDEAAFVKFFKKVYGSASPVLSKAAETAEENGKPHFKLFTTTPNFLEDPTAKFVKGMIDMAAVWDESLYDFTQEELHTYIYENSKNDFVHIEYSWRQLGKDEKWYEKQCRDLNWDSFEIKKEVDIEWMYASSLSPFNEESMDKIKKALREPVGKKLIDKKWTFEIYKELDPLYPYMISVDVAGGLDRDSTAIKVIDPKNMEPVATFSSNKITLPKTKGLLKNICTTWLLEGAIVIERNSYGLSIIQDILEDRFYAPLRRRLFYFFKEFETATKSGSKDLNKLREHSHKGTKVYGINTTGPSRLEMIDLLGETIDTDPEILAIKPIFTDIQNLERKKNGKIEHRDDEHDDNLFSWLIGKYASQQTTFKRFYKIGSRVNLENAERFRKVFFNLQIMDSDFSPFSQEVMKNVKDDDIETISPILDRIYKQNKQNMNKRMEF